MANAEREAMEARLATMTPDERDKLLLDMAQSQRPGDDDLGRARIQDAELILRMRPKIEVWTLMPRTGRIDKRTQDIKVWVRGIIDPLANEDQPDRPQIIKVIDLSKPADHPSRVLFERDTVMGQPQPGQPVQISAQPAQQGPDLAAQILALLRSNPELRQEVMAMDTGQTGPEPRRRRGPAREPEPAGAATE